MSYFTDIFNVKTNSVKQLWHNLTSVASLRKPKNKNPVNKLLINNEYSSDLKTIMESLNNYFCTIGGNLQKNINNPIINAHKSYLPLSPKMSMFCAPASETVIYDVINRMHNNKSVGPDNIGPRLIKEIIPVIINALLYLFNLSLTTGVVPDALKIAKVIHVYKKGNRHPVGN